MTHHEHPHDHDHDHAPADGDDHDHAGGHEHDHAAGHDHDHVPAGGHEHAPAPASGRDHDDAAAEAPAPAHGEAPAPAHGDGHEGDAAHRSARVVVASNRAAAGVYEDTTGPVIERWLQDRGWTASVDVVPDGEPVGAALRRAVGAGVDLVVTTGGTGASPTDRTPEQTRAVIDFEVPGIAEEIRRVGAPHTPKAVLSRGLAGVAGHTVIVNLPGSSGGVRDGLGVLDGVLVHLIDQIHGGDHARVD
ncbi:MogA/MoaB family molybdenum cofactor biosynthesis protein [Herbiconiux sp. VKM Ac-1786]|uniref:MogA/MoaB family molybdenum cofactor biosynthesis protein n=1 Tax=Herbiconiux sp. VKM Ac-1786 TaxID=2783824 RepID=UPI00188C0C0B|nr:MogA/MoaB family molybdenum cofactor biosynthesis protein [Herbiconiux sp. VKM Ac-1786]MBF4574087.1 MogA/MoaB family molybdenum cofactor biosynthesis protein [Herbiconiux sp. VKM Ac-1786]